MNRNVWKSLIPIVCLATLSVCGGVWALDEAVLTPALESRHAGTMTEKDKADAEKAFGEAMSVWHKHRYAEGEKLLGEFAAKHPNSRWRAEAELHQGCYLTYLNKTSEAKPIFERLASEFAGTNIETKAQLRLAGIAEQEVRVDEAIAQYAKVLKMNPTWDQFKYANYNARKLIMNCGKLLARINCGPVALAACLDVLGKKDRAAEAREIKPTADGMSLGALESLCASYSVPVKSVEMTLGELEKATLPILAYVEPKHFIAVLGIEDGKARIEDSVRGKHEVSLKELGGIWGGRVLTFAPTDDMKPLTQVASLETKGGCCGQMAEDECMGCPGDCQEGSSGGGSSGCSTCGDGGGNGGSDCPDCSKGRPTWKVNTNNMNLLVSDTPVWYSPGKGYDIAFTLNYSNENSNTGIFGRGWRSVYDMKVFFLPSGYQNYPTLQVHRDTGRIETYLWNGTSYAPRSYSANYGYRDAIKILSAGEAAAESQTGSTVAEGSVMLTRRGGGKYFFKPGTDGTVAGRIHIIQDQVGNRVTCGYNGGCLASVTDANGGVTEIETENCGTNERVTHIRIPRYVDGDWVQWSDDTDPERRQAELDYTNGNLVSITDMLGETSTLVYGSLDDTYEYWSGSADTYLAQNVTANPLVPADDGSLTVESTADFPLTGRIAVHGGANPEYMTYNGKTSDTLDGIKRGSAANALSGSWVQLVQPTTTLSSAITTSSPTDNLDVGSTDGFPSSGMVKVINAADQVEIIDYSGKTDTQFTGITRSSSPIAADADTTVYYVNEDAGNPYLWKIETPSKKTEFTYEWWAFSSGVVALHEVFECGPTEGYPGSPTIHYEWNINEDVWTVITKYGLTTTHYTNDYDRLGSIEDELGNTVVEYGYNNYRDRTSVTDANGHTTWYNYGADGKHDLYSVTDPRGNTRSYTYYDDHSVHTERDAYNRLIKTYTPNAAGQVTQIDMPLDAQTTYHVYYNYAQGRMDYSIDARGKRTDYHYGEDGEGRGFLTSVHDPEGKATLYHYDSKGRRDQVTDASGNVTKYEHDDLDRVTKTIFGSGANAPYTETRYTCCHKVYDQDENGRRTYYVYDAKVRPYKTITSAWSTTLLTGITMESQSIFLTSVVGLPSNGGKIVILDEVIQYSGISGNELTGITRGADSTRRVEVSAGFPVGLVGTVQATYGYHPQYLDRMISLTDALGHTTHYDHYLNGKLKTIHYPDDQGERYTYDGNGSGPNMIMKEYGDFIGTTFTPNTALTVHYEYDVNDRLLRTYH